MAHALAVHVIALTAFAGTTRRKRLPLMASLQLEDDVINSVAKYLYSLAELSAGHTQNVYLDAADALMDVMGMWADDERSDEPEDEPEEEPEGDAA
jgi:hypothetical protein